MGLVLGRLPLKPPKPRESVGPSSSIPAHSIVPAVRTHRGTTSELSPEGVPLPVPKQRRVSQPGPPRLPNARALAESDPCSVLEWPPVQPPVILSEKQSEDLGEYIKRDADRLEKVGFEQLVAKRRGRSNFNPGVGKTCHKAARFLEHLRKRGANVTLMTPPWDKLRVDEMTKRGPHKSAVVYAEFLQEELLDFVQKGFWLVLACRLMKKYKRLLRNLRISPMGVVPQRARRPRVIVDYSFYYGLNAETLKLAPCGAMQFGKALERILQTIVDVNPKFGPVQLIKIDIADGFYRIWLNVHDIPKLAVALPALHGTEPLLALPLVLPMGWTKSPPYFCAATETVTDVANRQLANHWRHPPHRLEAVAHTPPEPEPTADKPSGTTSPTIHPSPTAVSSWPTNRCTWKRPIKKVDIVVDDFVAVGQGDAGTLSPIRHTLFHTLDEVFRPLEKGNGPYRQEPASTKKLRQGDVYWATRKLILGWIIDTALVTLELPEHRKQRLLAILDNIPSTQK
jgi:hypothetical protein